MVRAAVRCVAVVILVALAARAVWVWRHAGLPACDGTHDWDGETYCVIDGCPNQASHEQLIAMCDDSYVVEYVCCQHLERNL